MAPDAGSTGKVAVLGAGRRRAGAKCAEFEGHGVERERGGAIRVGGGVLDDRTPSRERARAWVRRCPRPDARPKSWSRPVPHGREVVAEVANEDDGLRACANGPEVEARAGAAGQLRVQAPAFGLEALGNWEVAHRP